MSNYGLTLFVTLLAAMASRNAAPPPIVRDPLKGVVVVGDVVNCVLVKDVDVEVHVHPLAADRRAVGRRCAISVGTPVRWQIGQGAFWVCHNLNPGAPIRPPEVGGGYLVRIGLGVFFEKGEDLFNRTDAHFQCETPAGGLTVHAFHPRYFFYSDYLPAGKSQARQFVATNLTSKYRDREKDFRGGKSPASVFSCDLGESRFDAKEGLWRPLLGKREWSAPLAFKEPFQALALGDDFYFVTRSGGLFRAAKPAKGTDRVLSPIWDGKKQPIKAFITDAGTGKTFLFVPPAKDGGKPAFFELSDKPKLVEYDPKLVPLPPHEEPHRTILHHARLLVALKKIKGDPPAKGGDKKAP